MSALVSALKCIDFYSSHQKFDSNKSLIKKLIAGKFQSVSKLPCSSFRLVTWPLKTVGCIYRPKQRWFYAVQINLLLVMSAYLVSLLTQHSYDPAEESTYFWLDMSATFGPYARLFAFNNVATCLTAFCLNTINYKAGRETENQTLYSILVMVGKTRAGLRRLTGVYTQQQRVTLWWWVMMTHYATLLFSLIAFMVFLSANVLLICLASTGSLALRLIWILIIIPPHAANFAVMGFNLISLFALQIYSYAYRLQRVRASLRHT